MNKNLHRIIFNAARGVRMVVAETAKSASKASGATPALVGATLATLAAVLASPLALAQIVADPNAPGNQRPTVLTAPNGVPLVNIQTPSAAGVSRNTYQQFDVNSNGAILNNSRTSVQTQLGGYVQGNPWLAQGSARVILNEVNSANPSYLRGYTEVAGQRAEVILANPAGIQIDGGGFINASGVTLTTGSPLLNGGSLDAYRVQQGAITIDGGGLDTRGTDYTNILARAVQVNAGIWATNLRVTTGANQIAADPLGAATPIAGSGAAPGFALDVGQLGGMYANKIFLVGTEAGLGMRNSGFIGASAGEVVLNNNGWLSNSGQIQATGDAQIQTVGSLSNSGTMYAHAQTSLSTQGSISNTGLIAAQGNTSVQATGAGAGINSTATSAIVAGLAADGSIAGSGQLDIGATDAAVLNGQTIAAGQGRVHAAQLNLAGGQLSAAHLELTARTGGIDASRASVVSQGLLSAQTTQTLRTDGASVSAQQLQLSAHSLSNVGGEILQTGAADLNIGLAGDLDNRSGRIASNSTHLGLGAQILNNTDGRIEHAGAGTLAITATTLDGARGQIVSNGNLSLAADRVNHDGASTQAQHLDIQVGSLSNRAGEIIQTGTQATQIRSSGNIDNQGGVISSNGDTTVSAQNLLNQGGTVQSASGANLHITAAQSLDNSAGGQIAAGGQAILQADSLNNTDGRIEHAGAGTLAITATTLDGARGQITSNGGLSLVADRVNHDGASTQAQHLDLQVGSLSNRGGEIIQTGTQATQIHSSGDIANQGGTIASNGNTSLAAQNLFNQGGVVQSASGASLHITAAQVLDNSAGGQIAAGAQATLNATSLNNSQGRITAGSGLTATLAQTLDNRNGLIAANQDVRLDAQSLDNRQGQIASVQGSLDVGAAGSIHNAGGKLQALRDATLTSTGLSNTDAGQISAGTVHLDTQGQALDNHLGSITASTRLQLDSGALHNQGGLLQSGGALSIDTHGQTLDNTHAAAHASGQGGISSQGTLTLRTGTLDNTAGFLGAQGELRATTGQVYNAAGQIVGESAVYFTSTGFDNSAGGQVQALGDTHIQAGSGTINNSAGLMRSAQTLDLQAGRIDNSQTLVAGLGLEGRNVLLGAPHIDNTQGTIRADQDTTLTSSGSVNNTAGLISAGNTLTVQDTAPAKTLQITNTGGTLIAGTLASVSAAGLGGDGKLLSKGDLNLTLTEDFRNQGEVIANGNASITTAGTLDNSGKLQAGNTLTLQAQDINNQAAGEISGTTTLVNATGSLSNRGLIDGQDTQIRAGTLNNIGTGRIYGDTLGIQAGTVNNGAEGEGAEHKAAVIAARERLDIGAQHINNQDGAEILSAGMGPQTLNIGGSLDAQGHAVGSAQQILNRASSIESMGDMQIETAVLQNLNVGFSTKEETTTQQVNEEYIVLRGSQVRYRLDELGRCFKCDSDHNDNGSPFLNRLEYVEPSVLYPFSAGYSRTPYQLPVVSVIDGETSVTNPYAPDDVVWSLFNVPVGDYDLLRPQLQAYNADFMERAYRDFDHIVISSTQSTDTVVDNRGVAGRIVSAGDLTLRVGSTLNDNSQILAGGLLDLAGGTVTNTETPGHHLLTGHGTWSGDNVKYSSYGLRERYFGYNANYSVILETGSLNLSSSRVEGGAQITPGATQPPTASTNRVDAVVGAAGSVNVGSRVPVTTPQGVAVEGVAAWVPSIIQVSSQVGDGAASVVRTTPLNPNIPGSSLYSIHPSPGSNYLVETDPRFANYRQWLGSDYLLNALSIDPASVQKRLGDGFYEQRLVREQVAQLSGQRFLGDYRSDDEQYRALLESGVTYAKQWGLRPGIALTAVQMAQLTSDIVWLVEQEVTLPDGSTTRALVPQVYVRVQAGDINGNGSLIAGRDVSIKLTGDLTNSGTIAGRQVVNLVAENIHNLGGRISGNAVSVQARQDLNNIGATISAQSSLSVSAGRDLNLQSTTHTASLQVPGISASRTSLDRVAGLYVTGDKGVLVASAGRDANIIGGVIASQGSASLTAQRDLNLGTIGESSSHSLVVDDRNRRIQGASQEVGSQISAAGPLTLQAGRDLNATAANVQAEGRLDVSAARDVNILAGQDSQSQNDARYARDSGTFSSSETTSRQTNHTTTAQGSSFGGQTVSITAGRDIQVQGSSIVSDQGTSLAAQNNIAVEAATNTSTQSQFHEEKKSGLMGSGGIGFTVGKRQQSEDQQAQNTTASASTIGAVSGNVSISAGNQYRQVGSDIVTPGGDTTIRAKNVDIIEARETGSQSSEQKFKQSGLTVAITSPLISAGQTIGSMARSAGQSSDARMQALAAATGALAAKNAVDEIAQNPGQAGGVNLSISAGSSKSQSNTSSTSDTARGSSIQSGGNVSIVATGAGQDSNILIQGSSIKADGNVTLSAENQVNLLAAQNTSRQTSSDSSSSGSIGMGLGTDGWTVNASASKGRGNSEGQDTSYTNTQVQAGNTLIIQSAGDTNLRGAVASGKTVIADIAGNLNIESLQDSSTYTETSKSMGGGVSIPIGAGTFGASVSVGKTDINSTYNSVTQQSGILAGNGGFDIVVAGNTDLKGAVISSTPAAIDDNKNRLVTGSLTQSAIDNKAEYSGQSVNISLSYSGEKKDADGNTVMQNGKPVQDGYNGFNAAPPMALNANGNASSTTQSGISAAQIVITDEDAQKARTGKDATATVANLNRDVATGKDSSNTLKPIFNEQEITAGFEIAGAFGKEASLFLENRARDAEAQKKEIAQSILNSSDPQQIEALKAQSAELDKWGMGGTYSQIGTAFIAAVAGNVGGSTAQIVQAAGVNYLQSLGAQQIKELADSLGSESARAALHAVAACAGAAAQSSSCASGAAGAALSSLVNTLLGDSSNATAEQKSARSNLIAALTAGIASGLGGDAAAASAAARIETDNNAQYRNASAVAKTIAPQSKKLDEDYASGKIGAQDYAKARTALDASSAKIDALTTIYNASDKLPLAQSLGQMKPEHMAMLGEAIGGLLVVPGMATSAYELLNGKTVSGEEANYFFAALGVIPGAAIGKGVGKAADLASVLTHLPSITAATRIAENQAKGMSFEKAVIAYLGTVKNAAAFTVQVSGKTVTVIPDALLGAEKILEVKNVAYLTSSPQLRAYVQLVAEGATTKAGATLSGVELVVTQGTVISKPLQAMLIEAQATVSVFDPVRKTMSEFKWTVAAKP